METPSPATPAAPRPQTAPSPEREWRIYALLAALGCLSAGPLFFSRGIWWDDWYYLWFHFVDPSCKRLVDDYRMANMEFRGFIAHAQLMLLDWTPGQAVLLWKWIAIAVHGGVGLTLYPLFRQLFPAGRRFAFVLVAFFMTSPIVFIQPIAILTSYHLFLLVWLWSVLLSFQMLAAGTRGKRLACGAVSAVLAVVALRGLQSLILFEAVRPFFFFHLLQRRRPDDGLRRLALGALAGWIPFAAAVAVAATWHALTPSHGPLEYYNALPTTAADWIQRTGTFTVLHLRYILAGIWFNIGRLLLNPYSFAWTPLLLAAAAAAGFWRFGLRRLPDDPPVSPGLDLTRPWIVRRGYWIAACLVMLLLGMLPYAAVGSRPTIGALSRHAILSVLPICILFTFATEGLRRVRVPLSHALLVAVIGLNVVAKVHMALGLEADWQQQRSFWKQAFRRWPELPPGTLMVADVERPMLAFKLLEGYRYSELAAPLNLFYAASAEELRGKQHRYFATTLEGTAAKQFNAELFGDAAWHHTLSPRPDIRKDRILLVRYADGVLEPVDPEDLFRRGRGLEYREILRGANRLPGGPPEAGSRSYPFRYLLGPD